MSDPNRDEWPVTWEDNRRLQLEASLGATVDQRVAWLEEALELAAASGALERRRRQGDGALER